MEIWEESARQSGYRDIGNHAPPEKVPPDPATNPPRSGEEKGPEGTPPTYGGLNKLSSAKKIDYPSFCHYGRSRETGCHKFNGALHWYWRIRAYQTAVLSRFTENTRDYLRGGRNKMLDVGIIESFLSEWSTPIVMIRKSNRTYRFCLDFWIWFRN